MIKVSTTGMAVSLKTDLRFPESGQHGHGSRIIHLCRDCSFEQCGKLAGMTYYQIIGRIIESARMRYGI
ncbi:MAG: hypothetical protein SOU16_09455 [Faecalimonas sp.]|nr:hypothetical protein [Faecalimonas sp.]